MIRKAIWLAMLVVGLCSTSALACEYEGLSVNEIRALPCFKADDTSMSGATNSGDPDAPNLYWWIGYIADDDTRVYFTSYGEPLTCVKFEETGEWVPKWVFDSLTSLVESGHITGLERIYEAATDINYTTFDGTPGKLSDHFGVPIVLNFWADWCGPCRGEMPAFQEVWEELEGEFEFLAVSATSSKDAPGYMAENGFTFNAVMDVDGMTTYGVKGIPTTFFIDTEGKIRHKQVGGMTHEVFLGYLELILK